ncbi:peptidase inhibitor family I36 protein [Microbispora sp. H11081]|uniref:peptidase inhibitor family I36 protein n=1 Tax=Microbispora sp. H11081 TaxID=2729107 RepID=UPI00147486C2|nr:peptidase inhibitor family I36 protein [Microbispora sp. H11081]
MRKSRIVAVLLAGIAAAAVTLTGTSVHAASAADDPSLLHRQARSDTELRQQVELQLKVAPGGVQTSRNEVSYDKGRFVVTYALPGQAALAAGVADCPSGSFCFYDGKDYGYPRGKLRDCGWQDLATWGWNDRTTSVHNNTNWQLAFIEHDDLGVPAYGHGYDYSLWSSSPHAGWSYVGNANNNRADHVQLFC